jgi:flavin-dependent dehydrogenase
MEMFDVVIIGAGLSGLHAARVAARRGMSVLLVDRKPRVDAAIHTTGIFVRRSLEDFALPDACLGPPVRRVRLLGPSLNGITLDSPHDEFRVGRIGRLYLHLLDDAQRAGAAVRLATRYLGSESQGAATSVRLETGTHVTTVGARLAWWSCWSPSRSSPS